MNEINDTQIWINTPEIIFRGGRFMFVQLNEENVDPLHVSQLRDNEIGSYDEPDKCDSLDEACQIHKGSKR